MAAAPKSVRSLSELARALGVAPSTVTKWKGQGMPGAKRGRWSVAAVRAWRDGRAAERKRARVAARTPDAVERALLRTDRAKDDDPELFEAAQHDFDQRVRKGENPVAIIREATAKFRFYKAVEQEVRAKQASGDVIARSRVEDMLVERAAAFRRLVLQIPARVDAELAAETDPMEVRRILQNEIETMLADIVAAKGVPR